MSGGGGGGSGSGSSGGLLYDFCCRHSVRGSYRTGSHVTLPGVIRSTGGVTYPPSEDLAIHGSALDVTDRHTMTTAHRTLQDQDLLITMEYSQKQCNMNLNPLHNTAFEYSINLSIPA